MKKIAILVLTAFLLSIVTVPVLAGDNGKGHARKLSIQETDQENPDNTLNDPSQGKKNKKPKFSDIGNDWGENEILAAVNKGFMKGYGDGTFQPNKPLTCLEVIVALIQFKYDDAYVDDFDTEEYEAYLKKIPAWAWEEVAIALDEGIILPGEMQTFNPNQGIKRYQVVLYIGRMFGEDVDDLKDDTDCCDKEAAEEALDELLDSLVELEALLNEDDGLVELLENLDIDDLDLEEEDADELQEAVDEFLEDIDELDLENSLEDIRDELADAEDGDDLDDICDEIEKLLDELEALLERIDDLDIEDSDIQEVLEDLMDALKDIQNDLKDIKDDIKCQRFADDDQIPDQARNAARWVKRWRIINGDPDGSLSPMRVVKRNEIAAILNRMDVNLDLDFNYDNEDVTGEITDVSEGDGVYTLTVDDEEIEIASNCRLVFTGAYDEVVDLEGLEASIEVNQGGDAIMIRIGEIDDELQDILQDNDKVKDDIDDADGEVILLDNGDEYTADEDCMLLYSGQFIPEIDVEDYEATLYLDQEDDTMVLAIKIVD